MTDWGITSGIATPSRIVASLLLLCSAHTATPAWAQGALDRFERPHTRPTTSHDNDDDDDDSDDDDLSGSYSSWNGPPSPNSDDGGGLSSGSSNDDDDDDDMLIALCWIPIFTVPCILPAHMPSRNPYGRDGVYIEPPGERVGGLPYASEQAGFSKTSWRRMRYAELELSGFMALDENALLSHRLQATVWLGGMNFTAGWEHFYERLASGGVDHLNFYRFHYGFNLLGPYVEGLELYPRIGALLLHGQELTPALDMGAEARIYPAKPIAIYGSAIASVFERGPVLLDARLQVGVSVGRFEVRAGPRVLYQGAEEGFWGPAATVVSRF